jgi:hypothetical protein
MSSAAFAARLCQGTGSAPSFRYIYRKVAVDPGLEMVYIA